VLTLEKIHTQFFESSYAFRKTHRSKKDMRVWCSPIWDLVIQDANIA